MHYTPQFQPGPPNPGQLPTEAGSSRLRRGINVLLILLLVALLIVVAVPALRARYVMPLAERAAQRLPLGARSSATAVYSGLEFAGNGTAADTAMASAADSGSVAATSTPTPHPAQQLAFQVDEEAGRMRWRIAYADGTPAPGTGCAYLSFWLTGPDSEDFEVLDDLEAELLVYDGPFIFENYGRAPLSVLRSRSNPRYYELPPGAPECRRHRLATAAEYEGMEFRLSLLFEDQVIRRIRTAFEIAPSGERFMATITPTPTPAPPTATPYPQVRVNEVINVRNGPGTSYRVLGSTDAGAVYPVGATSPDRSWWQIDFQGQTGWVFGDLVQALGVDDIPPIANVPPTPVPTATWTPVPPTATVTPVPTPYIPFELTSSGTCDPNQAITYFKGNVFYESGDPFIGACVHVAYEGPRNTKCTGCDGAAPGEWGFSPFGNLPGKSGTTVRIYVVPCPEDGMPGGGQNPDTGFGPLAPVSPVWTYTIGESVQCTGITFTRNPPPVPPEE